MDGGIDPTLLELDMQSDQVQVAPIRLAILYLPPSYAILSHTWGDDAEELT